MSFRLQLFLMSLLAAVLMTVLGAVGLRSIGLLAEHMEVVKRSGQALRNHLDGDMMHDAIRGDVLTALGAANPAEVQQAAKDLEVHAKRFRQCLAENQGLPLDNEIKTALAGLTLKLEAYIAAGEDLVKAAQKDQASAKGQKPAFDAAFKAMEDAGEAMSDQIEAAVHKAAEESKEAIPQAQILILGTLGLGLVTLFLVGYLISRHLIAALKSCESAALTMGRGDLTARLDLRNRDETGRLADGMNRALIALCESMTKVNRETESLRTVSGELTGISSHLVQGSTAASSQAASAAQAVSGITGEVQTVAASLEEFSASSREVAANASKAAGIAAEAVRLGDAASTSMASLKSASESIGTVVKAVTDIAEQTNLLALNASIEAARAGESGKGFAVVAGEVKELARQSAAATTRIGAEVERIQAEVANTVTSLEAMGATIRTINDIQAGTAAAAEEQHATISEVSVAVQRAAANSAEIAASVDQVAQAANQGADGASQVAAAATRLNVLAEEMRQQLGRFKLG